MPKIKDVIGCAIFAVTIGFLIYAYSHTALPDTRSSALLPSDMVPAPHE